MAVNINNFFETLLSAFGWSKGEVATKGDVYSALTSINECVTEINEDKISYPEVPDPDGTKFLRSDGEWAVPSGGGGGVSSNGYFPTGW